MRPSSPTTTRKPSPRISIPPTGCISIPLTPEDVDDLAGHGAPRAVVVQFGGQTAIKLTKHLEEQGVRILGTSADSIDAAEDRERFDELLEQCGIPRPTGDTVFTAEEACRWPTVCNIPCCCGPAKCAGRTKHDHCLR